MTAVEEWLAPSPKTLPTPSSEWATPSSAQDGWVIVRGEQKGRRSPSALTTRSGIAPIDELLTCDDVSLPEVGARVVTYLERLGPTKSLALNWLALRLLHETSGTTRIGEHNRVAIIELLARNEVPVSSSLILQYLSLPLRNYHLFIVPLTRILGLLKGEDIREAITQMVRLLGETSGNLETARWQGALIIEVFQAASEISPEDVMGQMGGGLKKAGDLELTAVLESVSQAAQKLSATSSPETAGVRGPLIEVWTAYVQNKDIVGVRNRPGIMARLMEILARCGEPTDRLIEQITDHPLMHQVLYQFVQRPLDFLPMHQRLRVYTNALKIMVDNNQMVAAKRFMRDVFFPSLGPDAVKSIFRKIGSAAEEVR
jgi:hypothetical protein